MSRQKNEQQKIDLLISLSAAGSVQDEAAAFLATDTSKVVLRPAFVKRIVRKIRSNKHTRVKIAVAVALAAALLALSACACIPDVREYFWKIVTTDHGDYMDVDFESAEKTDTPETETEPESLSEPTQAPTSQDQTTDIPPMPFIEHKPVVDPLPKEYVFSDEIAISSQYLANYNTSDGKWCFTILMYLSDASHTFIDTEGRVLMYTQIHGNEAIVSEEMIDGVNYYMVVWREGAYGFTLQGAFGSAGETVSLAESIKLVPNQ